MIPKVKTWNVRLVATHDKPERNIKIDAPNKALARIIFKMDYPQFWGRYLKISLARRQNNAIL